MQEGRGGMGSRNHGVSGNPGKGSGLRRFLAELGKENSSTVKRNPTRMYASVREAFSRHKPK